MAAKEVSRGYYKMPGGKGNPPSISKARIDNWKLAIPVITLSFGLVGFYLGNKEEEKNAVYRDYQNQSDELFIK